MIDAPAPTASATPGEDLFVFPASFAQRRLWFLDRLEPGGAAYNLAAVVSISGRLEPGALAASLAEVVRRHEALRTTFAEEDGEPVQVVEPPPPIDQPVELPVVDLRGAGGREAEARRLAEIEAAAPFDLAKGPLLRARLLRLGEEEHRLVLVVHHIVADGRSLEVLVAETAAAYAALLGDRVPELPELPVQYADYTLWQQDLLSGGRLESLLAWWRERLAGLPPSLELPADGRGPTGRGASIEVAFRPELSAALRSLARREGATVFMVLLSAFQAFLSRLTGEEDLAVGVPVANRPLPELEGLIGFFVNTLVLRGDLSGRPTFRQLLARTREAAGGAYAHQELPFERLVEELSPDRSRSRPPLVQLMLNLQGAALEPPALPGAATRLDEVETGAVAVDATLDLRDTPEGLAGRWRYDRGLFERGTMLRFARGLETLLRGAVSDPGRAVADLPVLSDEERAQLLREWNDTAAPPESALLHGRFEALAASAPGAVAISFQGSEVTYAELARRASGLARVLRRAGVGPEARVAVAAERGPDLVAALLGVLRAGGAYVPLDPSHPLERLEMLLEDARPRVLLGERRWLAALGGAAERTGAVPVDLGAPAGETGEFPDPEPDPELDPEHPAYVLYTSGSTGRPKGVVVPHRAAARFLDAMSSRPGFAPDDRLLAVTTLAFDISVLEVFLPLSAGATVVLADRETAQDGARLARALDEERITVLQATPATWRLLLESGWAGRPELRLLCGGEALPRPLADELLRRGRSLWNLYGPTETTVWSAAGPVHSDRMVTVGRPIAGTEIYLLDRDLRPAPLGAMGEVYIGGEGVSRGYLDRPDLTAERFLPHPFTGRPGARLYRVGDLGRFRPDGELEILGRVDHQVKLRGFRVEPGEIEAALAACPGVAECAVVAAPGPDGGPRLGAWVVGGPAPGELRAFLAARLPAHMVPAAFGSLPTLPRLPNGKLDRRALAALEPEPAPAPAAAPKTMVEEVLAGVWAEVLGLPEVPAGAHFFDLGGHSLLATRVVSRVRQALGVELPVAALFEAPELSRLAERIEAARRLGGRPRVPPLEKTPRDRDLPLSFAQQRLWFLDRLVPENPFYNMAIGLRLAGRLDPPALAGALSEVVRRHESLRTTFAAEGGVPRQTISPPSAVPLPVADLSALPIETREPELERSAGAAARRPFDLEHGPLLRALLVRLGPEDHALALTLHHIVSDGWSLTVLEEELAVLYGAFHEGRPSPLPELPVQYADFAVWQRRRLAGEALEELLSFWKGRLAGAPDRLELPADRPRSAGESRGGSAPVRWPASLGGAIRALARREGATPAMISLAAFQALLSRLSGLEDLLVGSPVANRNRREVEGLIGFFANTLVLRGDLSGDPGFRTLLARVREASLAAYDHQDLPFERLVEELDPERSLGRNPLIQVVLGFQNLARSAPAMPGLAASPLGGRTVDTGTSKFDLTLFLWEEGEGLSGLLEYDRGLFDRPTALRLLGQLEGLLGAALESPETRLSELPLLSPGQRHQLVHEWGGGEDRWPVADNLADRFVARARFQPDAVAVTCEGESLTYAALAARAGSVARRLQASGVGRGDLVPLLLERSAGLVAGILGVLAAGAAYVPLDPDAPSERLAFALEDTGAAVALTQASLAGRLPEGASLILLDDIEEDGVGLPACPAGPLDPAYAIYTSGSTGRPKGVLVSHENVLRLFEATDGWFGFGPGDVWSLFHSAAFDFSVWELWGALLYGGRLVVVPRWVSRSPEAFWELLLREGVTVLNQTPSAFRQLLWAGGLGPSGPGALRLVVFGGEALEPASLAPWFDRYGDRRPLLVNMYGITETTVHVTYRPLRREDTDSPASAIGVPIPDLSLHVVDRHGSPVPVGVPGELRVGGAGLALGYLGRPDLTAERFVPDPFGPPGARLYRSGDLARRRPDGDLEYLGRIDHQVKIRGFRIELGEIESALARHPAVRESAVTLWEDGTGDRRLAAYVVRDPAWRPAEGDPAGEQVTHWREVFDEVYRGETGDATFNIVGWDSAWTGEAIPAEDMREWLDDTIDRLRALAPRRILEIGCGTGMLLFRLAPDAETYTATDLSERALAGVEAGLASHPEASRVTLLRRGAEDFSGIDQGAFDLVILNSVVQYFPSVDYLVEVIGKAVRALRPGGALFLGDLRSLPLLPAFQAGAELLRAEPELPLAQLQQRVRARALLEDELLLDPALFGALRRRIPEIGRVEVLLRRGRAANELNAFRYQAILRVSGGPAEPAPEVPEARDWEREGWTLERLAERLDRERPDCLVLSGLPNARVAAAAAAARLLEEPERKGRAGDLRRESERVAAAAVDPQAFLDLAAAAGYEADLGWARHGADGRFDAVFRRAGEATGPLSALLPGLPEPEPRSWSAWASDPFQGRFAREAVPELRRFLGERLPDYMVPAAFVVLDALPLTGNGKVDRRALPPPASARTNSGAYEAPRTPVERKLAAIWEELLGLDRVGVRDDFFALGAHSLLATRVVSRLRSDLGVDVPLRRLFEAPTLEALAREAETAGAGPAPPLRHRSENEPAPLSFAQERLWFLDQLTPGRAVYNVPAVVRLSGSLDIAAFAAALDGLALRHETLRATVSVSRGQAVQAVSPAARLPLPLVDLEGLPEELRRAETDRLAAEEARQPFDLEAGPLARAVLLRLGEDEHLMLLTLHHLICDGWSVGVLVRDLAALYRGTPLPELPVRYSDWAVWQREWLTGAAVEARLAPWRRRLAGVPPRLDLPTDRPRPPVPGLRGGVRRALLPGGLLDALRRRGRGRRATPFMALLAAFQALLHRHAGQDDFCVGSPVANRTRAEVEGLVGLFVNALALRADLSGDPAFAELVDRAAVVTLEAYENQDLPFERLVAELQPERDLGRQPLFQVVFLLQNTPLPILSLPGLTLAPQEIHTGTAKFDLTLELLEEAGGFAARLEYAADLFDDATAERLLERYAVILDGAEADPDRRVSELPLLPAAELRQILAEAGDVRDFPVDASLHRRFEERARMAPDAVAVTAGDRSLTYRELDRQAGRLARAMAGLGIGPESRVALLLPRSANLVAAVLGVLKTGAAYVPIEPGVPEERLTWLLADSGASALVSGEDLTAPVPVIPIDSVGHLEPLPSVEPPPEAAAYVIYTSGSTGRPKGVVVSHGNAVRLFDATRERFGFGADDVWTLFHSYAFDFSVWEIWGALLHGGRLVVVPWEVSRSPEAFLDLLAAEGVTMLSQTPSAFRQLAAADEETPRDLALRWVVFGGEALDFAGLRSWVARRGDSRPRLMNMYGITETTVHVTWREVRREDLDGPGFVGGPIPDLRLHLLDARRSLVPLGVPGEIHVGGAGLARGYLGRPDLTAERFVPDPFGSAPGARLYRSGDLARYLAQYRPDGEIEYLGRIDHQVKIRGVRIELGEVEAALASCPGVRESAVLAREDGEDGRRLVAYVVPGQPAPTVADLRQSLSQRLPEALVPSAFVLLDAFPLTANGKLDRRALPAPGAERPDLGQTYAAPATPAEEGLAAAWAEALGLDRVGAEDNFFALGGDSIRAIRVRHLAAERGLRFPLHEVFRRQTVRALAEVLEAEEEPTVSIGPFSLLAAEDRERLPDGIEDAYPVARLQAGLLFHGDVRGRGSAVYLDVFSFHLRSTFDGAALAGAVGDLVQRHEALRTSFELGRFREPLQLVHREVPLPLEIEDLGGLSLAEREARVEAWIEDRKAEGFDPARPPLLRFAAHAGGDGTFHLTLVTHHAILDGWSVATLLSDFARLYRVRLGETSEPLEPLRVRFRDFVAQERAELESGAALGFWRARLEGAEPTRFPRQARPARRPDSAQRLGSRPVPVPDAVLGGLRAAAARAGVHLKHVLFAAYARALGTATGRSEAQTGVAFNGRSGEEGGERVVGLFLNTLPLRLDLRGGTWLDLARRAFEAEREVLPHRRYPLADLQRELGGGPLFETAFNFVHFHVYRGLEGVPGLEVLGSRAFAETDFTLLAEHSLSPDGSRLSLTLDHDAGELDAVQIERLAGHLAAAHQALAVRPEMDQEERSLLSEAERHQLLAEWNDTAAPYPAGAGIDDLFREQARRRPGAVAVEQGDVRLTYGELDARAGRLAGRLRRRGVGAETLVGLCLERSPEMVVALLAILRAGGAYVPLDPSYPRERLAFLLEDTGVDLVLTTRDLEARLPHDGGKILLDLSDDGPDEETVRVRTDGDRLAYVTYTSGSTGVPKGVAVPHRGVLRLVFGGGYARLGPDETLLLFSPLAFDASTFEVWGCLLHGGRLVIAPPGLPSLAELARLVEAAGVTTLWLTTSLFHQIAESHLGELRGLRQLLTGGDVISPAHLRRAAEALPGCRVVAAYGPTETTTFATTFPVVRPEELEGGVPLGRPIGSTVVLVLDAALRPVPAGAPGEVWIGGDGLTRGYWNRPDLTAERFRPHPFATRPGERLYRTGDLARRRDDGVLEFLGRIDDQVKIRGHRVEPGEVEAVLARHPDLSAAVVLVRRDSSGASAGASLAAFAVAYPGAEVGPAALRRWLEERLPAFLVPASIAILPELPLAPSGKVDRRALLAQAAEGSGAGPIVPEDRPSGPVQELLAELFAEVLGRSRVGARESFFELGGHSLAATRLVSRVRDAFGVELPLRALFEEPTVAGLAERVEETLRAGAGPLPPALASSGLSGEAPLSFAQQRLWFLDRWRPGDPAYNVPGVVSLRGPLQVPALLGALAEVVRRQGSLRTTFHDESGIPYQRIYEARGLPVPLVDLGALPPGASGPEAERLSRDEARAPFDLCRGPVFRARLLRLGPEENRLLLTVHHAVADGGSVGVLLRELGALYEAAIHGRPSPLPEPPVQYADFAVWQRGWLQGEVLEEQVAGWRRALEGLPPLEVPGDRPRPAARSGRGGTAAVHLDPRAAQELAALARREGSTLFMVLLGAFQALLARVSGASDLAVGAPVAGRRWREVEGLVGFFVNTLALRARFEDRPSVRLHLARTRETLLAAFARQDAPFELLVERLEPERDPARPPLVQTMAVLQEPPPPLSLPGLEAGIGAVGTGTAKLDLTLSAAEAAGGSLELSLEYDLDLFDRVTALRLAGACARLLEGLSAAPGAPVLDLPLLGESERRQIAEWNDTGAAGSGPDLVERFEERARHAPGALAVSLGNRSLSYGELDALSGRIAARLARLGAGPETVVALRLERTPELIAAMLGILRAGAAFLPLDPSSPPERLEAMLADAGARLVITEGWLAEEHPEEAFSRPPVAGSQLAYVIFTSGSTGRPKGVALTRGGLDNLVRWHLGAFGLTEADRVSMVAGLGFDAAVWEVWPCLAAGASLHLPSEEVRLSPERLAAWMASERVTVAFLPTPVAERLAELPWPVGARPRLLLTGGDRLRLPEGASLPAPLVNNYGPTEGTVVATSGAVLPGEATPSIGGPIAGARVHLLDSELRPALPGAPGELCLAGAGLARGYLGRSDATAAAFVPDPFPALPGDRLYRTGDRARWLQDGRLEFLGRIDAQVKIRGFRVEPGEAEAALRRQPGIRDAAVVARKDDPAGDARLVAWVVGEGWTADGLRRGLREVLPDFLVPSAFLPLESLPLNASGKVDRRALARLEAAPAVDGGEPPRTPTERRLAALWGELLGVEAVSRDADFFALGGHSLLAARLVARLGETFGVEPPLRDLFAASSLAAMASLVDEARPGAGAELPPLRRIASDRPPLSFAQQRLWFLDQLRPGSAAYTMPVALRAAGRLDPALLAAALGEMVRRHETLRTTFGIEAGVPFQRVAEWPAGRPVPLPEIDLRALPPERSEAEAARLAAADARRPFDLERGPLARFGLVRLGEDERLLLASFHHTVSDGWSFAVFARDLAAVHAAFAAGRPSPLPGLPVRYADFAAWQRLCLDEGRLGEDRAYWLERLGGELPALDLPGTPAGPGEESRASAWLDPDLASGLRRLTREGDATLFMGLLALVQLLLGRLSGEEDVIVGTPVAGRPRPELEGLVGLFLNTLALRTDLSGDPPFRGLLERARDAALGAFAHQALPFERLVEELQPDRDPGRNPVFDVMVNLLNMPREELRLGGATLSWQAPVEPEAKVSLTLFAAEEDGGLRLDLLVDRRRFSSADAGRMLEQLETLLRGVLAAPEAPVGDHPMLTPACRAVLPDPAEVLPEPRYEPVTALFAAWAGRQPGAPAVVQGDLSLTYGELLAASERLAAGLGAWGVRTGDVVAVRGRQGPGLIAAIAGVLASGGVLLLLDPDLPAQRHHQMVELAGASRLLRLDSDSEIFGLPVSAVDPATGESSWTEAAPLPAPDPDGAAYIFFTSGSTGVPKGVVGVHKGLSHFVAWESDRFEVGPANRCAQLAAPAVDVILRESFLALTSGAALVLPDPGAGLEALPAWCERERITLVHTVPTLARSWLAAPPEVALSSVRWLLLVGEPLPAGLVSAWRRRFPGSGVVNLYGSTESNLAKSYFVVPDPPPPGTQPAGRPLPQSQLLVIGDPGDGRRACAVGEVGEIAIRTPFLSLGYLGRPEETAGRFAPNPFPPAAGERILLTGDRGRFRPDGTVEVLGRLDQQIKVRGVRVEPEEVAALLAGHPGVAACAVLPVRSADGYRLAACVVPREPAPTAAELLAYAARRLPAALVPSEVVTVDRLPLTATGKLDRRALARRVAEAVKPAGSAGSAGSVPPRTPAEELVAGVWAEVLGVERVGAYDNFFALGGHSLLATQIVARLRALFGVELPVRRLFEAPTVAALALELAGAEAADRPSRRPGEDRPLSFAQERMWLLDQIAPGGAGYNIPFGLRLRGPLDLPALERAFGELLRRHEVLRASFPRVDGAPVQRIADPPPFRATLLDLTLEGGRRRPLPRGSAGEGRGGAFERPEEVLGRSDEVLGRPDELVGGSREVLGPSEEVVGQSEEVAGRSDEVLGSSETFPEGPTRFSDDPERSSDGPKRSSDLPKRSSDGPTRPLDGGKRPLGGGERPLPAPAELLRLAGEEARRPFDLAAGPLYRMTVARLGEDDHAVLLTFHHAVFDGWSRGILASELSALYRGEALAPLPLQYADYAAWQRGRLAGGALDADLAWWRETLAGARPEIALPGERREGGPAGAHHRSRLPRELVDAAAALGRRAGATPFMVLLAAFDLLLWRWSGQDDLVVGTVVAHRGHVETEALIGCFINFLPVRLRVAEDGTGLDLLGAARSAVLGAYAHQDLPFEKLVEAVRPVRGSGGSGRSPLYNVGFLLQSFPAPRAFGEGLEVEALPMHNGEALLDLRLVAMDDGELWWEYDRNRFEPATIERLAETYEEVLRRLVEKPEEGIASVDLPAALVRERLVVTATFTAEPALQPLRFWLDRLGLAIEPALAPYHQVFQQLLDPRSQASANRRGANVVLARLEDWTTFRDGGASPDLQDQAERAVGDLLAGLREASARGSVPWIVVLCPPSPAFAAAVDTKDLEQRIVAGAESLAGVYAVASREIAEAYPVADLHDAHADRLGHVPYSPTFFTALGTMAVRRLHALRRPPYKVAVVDADNTLWTGVCGEDGPAGVVIDGPRRALQEFLVKQREAGLLLCLCSKNEPADVDAVFAAHPDMPLRPEHFAARRVSWNPKSEGVLALSGELGLGLDSFIFLDDNPVEIADVQARCPGVLCLRVPEEPRQLPGWLRHLWAFDRPKVTAEDRARAESYRQNREREALRRSAPSLEAFLAGLDLVVDVRPIEPGHLPRVAQLIERTNQFNLTLVRRSEAEVRRFLTDGAEGGEGLEVSVRDRFGDYGLVGVALFTRGAESLVVDTLLLSCRVLGRGVERRLLDRLARIAADRGLARVDLTWAPGERNRPALEFLETLAEASRTGMTFRVPVEPREETV